VSLSDTDREEVNVDVRPASSQKVGPLRISLQKKGEKSESTSKVHASGKVIFFTYHTVSAFHVVTFDLRGIRLNLGFDEKELAKRKSQRGPTAKEGRVSEKVAAPVVSDLLLQSPSLYFPESHGQDLALPTRSISAFVVRFRGNSREGEATDWWPC